MTDYDCHDDITFEDSDGVRVHVICQLLLVDSRGVPRGHINHRWELDIPGCEQARVSWTRRR